LTLQVDGTLGSAVVGLRKCFYQSHAVTPKAIWNPDIEQPIDFYEGWTRVPEQESCDNAFKAQWELFLRHVAADTPFRWTLLEGARGVQLAEAGLQSWRERRWVEITPLG
jgi:predicted dehydrogenase